MATTQQNQNVKGLLTYVLGFITGIIFLLIDKNKFVRFHAMQSTITFLGLMILGWIVASIPGLSIVNSLINLLSFVLWIVLMVKAYQGVYFKLPYIGDIAERQAGKMK